MDVLCQLRDPKSRQPLGDPGDCVGTFISPVDNATNLPPECLRSPEYLALDLRKRYFEGVYIDEIKGALDV